MNVHLKGSTKFLNSRTKDYIDKINTILTSFKVPLTVRQIYYQFRILDYFPKVYSLDPEKQMKELKNRYNHVQKACAIGRRRELIPWSMIRDTSRPEYAFYGCEDLEDWLEDLQDMNVQLDPWENSKFYLEVWTEKDAMTSIIKPIADKWRIGFFVTKGFQSLTQLWKAETKNIGYGLDELKSVKKKFVILYLGDHDPSGLCIDSSIKTFFKERNVDIEFRRIALTKEQALSLKILHEPCNPKDKRTQKYIEKFGDKAWELDAISPNQFPMYIEDQIDMVIKEYADFKLEDADKNDEDVTDEFWGIIQEDIDELAKKK